MTLLNMKGQLYCLQLSYDNLHKFRLQYLSLILQYCRLTREVQFTWYTLVVPNLNGNTLRNTVGSYLRGSYLYKKLFL